MNKIFNIVMFLALSCLILQSCGSDKPKVENKPVLTKTTESTSNTEAAPEAVTLENNGEESGKTLVKTVINGEDYYELDLSDKEGTALTEIDAGVTKVEKDKSSIIAAVDAEPKATPKEEVKEAPKPKPAPKKPELMPKINFENTTHKYGMIMQGDEITHKFPFTNTGKVDLLITDVKASCGCTQPSYPFVPIPPGEKGFIGVIFNSTGKLGPQKPTITVTSNASNKKVKLYLDGFVDAERAKDQTEPGKGIIDEKDLEKLNNDN